MKKGFTLIELLIVIAIIGVLAVALLPTISGGPGKARDAARTAALSQIVQGIENYNLDKGSYPTGRGCLGAANDTTTALEPYFKSGIPKDPNKDQANSAGANCTGQYYYVELINGAKQDGYAVVTTLEKGTPNSDFSANDLANPLTYAAAKLLFKTGDQAANNTNYAVLSK